MASERQIRANRANANKSTGPKTIDGKAVSSRNSVTHGLTARQVVMEWEDPAAFETLRQSLHQEFRPDRSTACRLVEHLAALLWRLRRSAAYESALITWISHQQAEAHDSRGVTVGPVFLSSDRRGLHEWTALSASPQGQDHRRTGRMLESAMSRADLLSKLGRYEAHLMRQVAQTIAELRRLAG
ncbi:MAG: hypothetical protein JNM89_03795 [Hyphomicrobiaceae bacterium]|nr:hypothetical protein [Hyphomicrobiaceae bacterium]